MIISANRQTGEVFVDGVKVLSLSKNEVILFELFYGNPDVIYSASDIGDICWPDRIVSQSSIPVAIKRVRDMIKKLQLKSKVITHKGVGYSFSLEDELIINFVNDSVDTNSKELNNNHRYYIIIAIILCLSIFLYVPFLNLEWNEISKVYIKENDISVITNSSQTLPQMKGYNNGDTIYLDQSNHTIVCNKNECVIP